MLTKQIEERKKQLISKTNNYNFEVVINNTNQIEGSANPIEIAKIVNDNLRLNAGKVIEKEFNKIGKRMSDI